MATSQSSDAPETGATRARQGRLGAHVLVVLVVALALAALALFGSWAFHSDELATTEPNNAREAADAQAFSRDDTQPVLQQPAQAAPAQR